jgi:hypothetical protein
LLQPFFSSVGDVEVPELVLAVPSDEEEEELDAVFFTALDVVFSSCFPSSFFIPNSFSAFIAWNAARPVVSVEVIVESARLSVGWGLELQAEINIIVPKIIV